MEEKISLLIIGDDLEKFPSIGKIVDHLGMELLHVTSVDQVLQSYRQHPVSLIIADATEPDFDHTTLINALRSDYEVSQIPMIIAGGDAGAYLARSADEAPMDHLSANAVPHLWISRIRMMTDWFQQKNRLEKLETENERLDTINKQVRKFVGNVAHDLRGPLGKLINTSEVLLSGVEPDALQTFYEMMAQTSRRGFNLVNDILDITALESGQLQLYFEKCDLGDVALQVVEELEYLAHQKELTLTNEVPIKSWVRADRRRIYQVFGNLINNSIKFTSRGGRIAISSEISDDKIRICVTDTGVGIPANKVGKIFQKHIKNSTPGTEGEKGTGFGLPLAQEIAMAHNSTITVKSEENKGTCFTLDLKRWEG